MRGTLLKNWRDRNKNKCRYTFRQNHYSGFVQWRLDYIFVSNYLQEYIKTTDIFNASSTILSDFCTFSIHINFQKGRGFWKFNNWLVLNENSVDQMRNHIQLKKHQLAKKLSYLNDQVKVEFLNYQIREFSISFS